MVTLPLMLAVDDRHRPIGGFEVIEQSRVDGDPTSSAIPRAVRLESGAVGIEVAATGRAEVIGDHSGVPAIDAIAVSGPRLEPLGRIVGVEVTALRAQRAGAARQCLR